MSIVCQKLATRVTPQKKMDFLGEEYPSLHIFILEHLKMHSKIEQYMAMCKKYEVESSLSNDATENYSLYIHGYLLPWFQ